MLFGSARYLAALHAQRHNYDRQWGDEGLTSNLSYSVAAVRDWGCAASRSSACHRCLFGIDCRTRQKVFTRAIDLLAFSQTSLCHPSELDGEEQGHHTGLYQCCSGRRDFFGEPLELEEDLPRYDGTRFSRAFCESLAAHSSDEVFDSLMLWRSIYPSVRLAAMQDVRTSCLY